ncbi:PqiC family protein [Aquabacterium sp.]|uniref:PqiC family protein n=1 Tax=Aquabacterium sp. TaxID=1872578 RepID=UPI003D6D211B
MTTTRRRHTIAVCLGLWTLSLTACSTPPPPVLLSLPLPPAEAPVHLVAMAPAAPASAASAPRFLTVRRVNIPEYLQTDAVRYRQADNTLGEWPGTAWAERLEVGLTNQLALLLRQALPAWTVCDAHCPSVPTGQVLIVNIAPLDYLRPAGQLRADVAWRVTGPGSIPTPVAFGGGSSTLPVTSDTPVGQAAAMSALLDTVAKDVANQLR